MKLISKELNRIIENHYHWLHRDCLGWENMRADLSKANLRGADLSYANLLGANLKYADLSCANLSYANLAGADLSNANLRNAILINANLNFSNLRDANLVRADLNSADLRDANLNADLRGAVLYLADLRGSDLKGANLRYADLNRASLNNAKNIPYIPSVCPEEGTFIGYKKAKNMIIKLEIPMDAKRTSATSRKCRCNKAKVLSITNLDGTPSDIASVRSDYHDSFIYKIGEIVEEPNFDDNRWHECTSGIHFFLNRQEAVEWQK